MKTPNHRMVRNTWVQGSAPLPVVSTGGTRNQTIPGSCLPQALSTGEQTPLIREALSSSRNRTSPRHAFISIHCPIRAVCSWIQRNVRKPPLLGRFIAPSPSSHRGYSADLPVFIPLRAIVYPHRSFHTRAGFAGFRLRLLSVHLSYGGRQFHGHRPIPVSGGFLIHRSHQCPSGTG